MSRVKLIGIGACGNKAVIQTLEGGNIIDLNRERTVHYKPAEAPEVPDTGGFFGSINLSRQDMVSTGLALLFLAGFFGILIVAKRNKDSKRR